MFVADNGTSWYITGSADRRWNDDDLDQLKSVPGMSGVVESFGPRLLGRGLCSVQRR